MKGADMGIIKRLETLEAVAAAKGQLDERMEIIRVIVAPDLSIISAWRFDENRERVPVSEEGLANIRRDAETC